MFRYCTATPVLPNSFCASAYITIASAKRYSGVSTSFSIQFTPLSLLRYLYGIGPSARVSCRMRSEEHTSELQSLTNLVCRLLLEKKKKTYINEDTTPKKNT